MIRVALADDQALVREGFRMILDAQEDIEVVGEAANGHERLELRVSSRPTSSAWTSACPELDGLEATRRILAGSEGARVLILTTFDLNEYVYEALRAGASGFLLKDSPRGQLLHAVRVVAGGDELLDPALTRRLIEECVRRPHTGDGVPQQLSELSERELEVLRLVARGLSNAGIAKELYVSEATVNDTRREHAAEASSRDRVQAVVVAYESGFTRPGEG